MKDALTAQHGVLRRRVDLYRFTPYTQQSSQSHDGTDKQNVPCHGELYSTYRLLQMCVEDGNKPRTA